MKPRRKEIASRVELELRLAELNWYLRQLEEWPKLFRSFGDNGIAAGTALSLRDRASLLLLSHQLGAMRADARIARRQGREARLRRAR
jgi:hypothetical protein